MRTQLPFNENCDFTHEDQIFFEAPLSIDDALFLPIVCWK